MSATLTLVRGIVGRVSDADGWAGPVALATVPLVPAVALVEGAAAGVRAAGRAVSWLRGRLADGLRAAADVLKPLPVATVAEYPVAQVAAPPVEAPAPVEEPVILAMPSAAQATTADEGPAALPLRVESPEQAAVAQHGSVRKAAKALGIAESTLRSRLKKQRG